MNMDKKPSDDDLVERIRVGDEKAAEELIKRYYTSILFYCKRHCFHLERAEDLTQETFLKLFKNLSGYKGKRKFKAYLYTIANHLCVDESLRGKHIGKQLYDYAVSFAKENGCYNLTLNVWNCNDSAMKFYEKCGLKPQKTHLETILK